MAGAAVHPTKSAMPNVFTAVIERGEQFWIACSPGLSGANGQGSTPGETWGSLAEAIRLLLQVRREEGLRGGPPGPIRGHVRAP
jgi:predicted RNase H-like HicB family nuclease